MVSVRAERSTVRKEKLAYFTFNGSAAAHPFECHLVFVTQLPGTL